MHKLKSVQTAMTALNFGWSHLGVIIRLGWVPGLAAALVAATGTYLFLRERGLDALALDLSNAEAISEFFFQAKNLLQFTVDGFVLQMIISIVTVAILAPLYVLLYRVATGTIEAPSRMAHFVLGQREFRFFSGYIIQILLSMLVALFFLPALYGGWEIFSAVPADSWALSQTDPEAFEAILLENVDPQKTAQWGMIIFLNLLIAVPIYLWVMMRLTAFLPLVAVENHLGLRRAFAMTKGNYWRILGATLLVGLILVGISMIVGIGFAILGGAAISVLTLLKSVIGAAVITGVFLLAQGVFMAFAIGVSVSFNAEIYRQLQENAV